MFQTLLHCLTTVAPFIGDQLTSTGPFAASRQHKAEEEGAAALRGVCFYPLLPSDGESRASLNGFRRPWQLVVFTGITVQVKGASQTAAAMQRDPELTGNPAQASCIDAESLLGFQSPGDVPF